MAPLFAARYLALRPAEFRLCRFVVSGIINRGAVRKRGEMRQAHVNADTFRRGRKRNSCPFDTKTNKPVIRLALHGYRFDRSLYRTVELDFDVACSLDAELAGRHQLATIPISGEGDRVVTARGFIAREPWRLATF